MLGMPAPIFPTYRARLDFVLVGDSLLLFGLLSSVLEDGYMQNGKHIDKPAAPCAAILPSREPPFD